MDYSQHLDRCPISMRVWLGFAATGKISSGSNSFFAESISPNQRPLSRGPDRRIRRAPELMKMAAMLMSLLLLAAAGERSQLWTGSIFVRTTFVRRLAVCIQTATFLVGGHFIAVLRGASP
jgi:hypothetical protein